MDCTLFSPYPRTSRRHLKIGRAEWNLHVLKNTLIARLKELAHRFERFACSLLPLYLEVINKLEIEQRAHPVVLF